TPPLETAQLDSLANSIGMKFVSIPAGSFVMGQDGPAEDYRMTKHPEELDHADWDEKPAHPVTISQGFQMGVTEVTLGQWRKYQPGFRSGDGADDEAVRGVT